MSYIILAINPGSTSTKIAVYEDTQPVLSLAINHSAAEIAAFATIGDQFEWRKDLVLESLRKRGFDIGTLSAVIGRGGLVHPVEGGVYEVNDALHDDLLHARRQHASNLGGLIAQEIAAEVGVKAYIADPVVVDEMIPYARISGLPQLPRESVFHALNQKAIARRYARETGRKYEELNLIVSHMGGGITVSAHRQGRVIDTSNALNGAGPFSPERAGTLPPGPLIDLCFSGEYTREELQKLINGRGGLLAHLGTTSVPEILRRIDNNDLQAMLVLRAMCYNVAKEIGAMAIALKGKADAILLTGGIAHNISQITAAMVLLQTAALGWYLLLLWFTGLLSGAVIGVLGGIVSQFGDLTASIFKRKMGIKDYGHLIPGHGGILDRFDSVLFTGPMVYYYIVLVIGYMP